MKLQLTMRVWVFTLFALALTSPLYATEATTTHISLSIEKALHFLIADGSDVVVQPGTYEVEAADEWIRLIPGERRDALLLEATMTHHEEDIHEPIVDLISEGEEQFVHLLLPGGKGLEAIGTESGVRSRAVKRSRIAKSTTLRKAIFRRPTKSKKGATTTQSIQMKSSPMLKGIQENRKIQVLEQTVKTLQATINSLQRTVNGLQNRLSKIESAVQVSNSGAVTLNGSSKINLNSNIVEISSGMVKINAGMSQFHGVLKADTVIANTVTSSTYTPGAGNIW